MVLVCRKALSRRGGVVLPELLVVMLIMAILAAIVIPIFAKQVERAEETAVEQQLHLALRVARVVAQEGVFPEYELLISEMNKVEPSLKATKLPSLVTPVVPGRVYVVRSGTTSSSILLAAKVERTGEVRTLFWDKGKTETDRLYQPTYEQLVRAMGPSAYWTLGSGADGLADKSGNGYTLNPLHGITNGGGPAFLAEDKTTSTVFNAGADEWQAYHTNYGTRRNLDDNPSFEAGTQSWAKIGNASMSRVQGDAHSGEWSLKVDIADGTAWRGVHSGAEPIDGRVSNLPDFQELLENPGFEQGTEPWKANAGLEMQRTNAKSYSGNWSVRVKNNTEGFASLWHSGKLEIRKDAPTNTTQARGGAWVWLPEGEEAHISLGLYTPEGDVIGYLPGERIHGNNDWQWVEHELAVSPGQLVRLHVAISAGAEAWVDDARLTDRPAPTLTPSAYIKGQPGETIRVHFHYHDASGKYISGAGASSNASPTLTAGWQRVVLPAVTAPLNAVTYRIFFRKANVDPGEVSFQLDSVLVEQTSSARAYFDGSTHGDASGWVGTPHLSPSDLGLFANGTQRTFMGWSYADKDDEYRPMMGSANTPVLQGGLMHIRRLPATEGSRFQVLLDGNNANYRWEGGWPGSGQWVFWAVVVDQAAGTVEVFVNGRSLGKQNKPWNWLHLPHDRLRIGHANGSKYWSGYQGQIAVFEKALDPSQICALWEAGSAEPCAA